MVSALNIIGSDRSLQEHWAKRFLAIIIDSMIFWAIGSILMFFVIIPANCIPATWPAPLNAWTLFWPAISGALLFLYAMVLEASGSGATIGKRMLGLRVLALTGEMGLGKAGIRNVSKIYGLFLAIDWLAGFISEGDPKQRWLDRVAGTTVVITSALSEQEQHIYQSQQSKFAPPPQEPYPSARHDKVYQYPPAASGTAPMSQASAQTDEANCPTCGGRMAETGKGRLKCIRCGKIQ